MSEQRKRCGECDNCKELEEVKKRVLACCNPPFSHADQGVVDLWNRELDRLPCEEWATACPGCGCLPGDGLTEGCDHPDGCGFSRSQQEVQGKQWIPCCEMCGKPATGAARRIGGSMSYTCSSDCSRELERRRRALAPTDDDAWLNEPERYGTDTDGALLDKPDGRNLVDTRCQDRSELGAQCICSQGHPGDHTFREDTASVWEDPGTKPVLRQRPLSFRIGTVMHQMTLLAKELSGAFGHVEEPDPKVMKELCKVTSMFLAAVSVRPAGVEKAAKATEPLSTQPLTGVELAILERVQDLHAIYSRQVKTVADMQDALFSLQRKVEALK